MEMGQWVMGHSQWPIDPWWNNSIPLPGYLLLFSSMTGHYLAYFVLRRQLLTHSIRPIITAGGLILIYDFFALKTERVVQYHHATPSPSPMRRVKWCNGHGSWVMGHVGHGSTVWWVIWVMGHERWPISISVSNSAYSSIWVSRTDGY